MVWLGLLSVGVFSIRDFGAIGDGVAKDTAAIQRTLDAAAVGGGEVIVPAGRYLCGTLHLRSHVALRLLAGATLAESPDPSDFDPYEPLSYDPESDRETSDFAVAMLAGKDLQDVSIEGPGALDGNRTHRGDRGAHPGPKPIALKRCQGVIIRDVTVENAPNYSVSLLGCKHVLVEGVTVRNGYSDGIDPDSCQDVRIANCDVECYDDGICPKASLALGAPTVCENVVVTGCVLRSASNQFKLGTESQGGFRNIVFADSVCAPREGGRVASRDRGGITLTLVDGGVMDGVSISNIVMRDLYSSIFVRLGDAGKHKVGAIRNVSLCHIVGNCFQVPVMVVGVPGHPVEHVYLDGLDLQTKGGLHRPVPRRVPEKVNGYPESNMFADPPAASVYFRHVKGLRLTDSRFDVSSPDARPWAALDDVQDARLRDVEFDGKPMLRFRLRSSDPVTDGMHTRRIPRTPIACKTTSLHKTRLQRTFHGLEGVLGQDLNVGSPISSPKSLGCLSIQSGV